MSERIQCGYEVIAWMNGMAIAEDEEHNLVFCRIPEDCCDVGDVLFDEDVTLIDTLPIQIQHDIWAELSKHGLLLE